MLSEIGFSRLKEFYPSYSNEEWFLSKVICPTILSGAKFKTYTIWDFDPALIIGTSHSDYNNRSWIEMLGSLKRYELNKESITSNQTSFINNTSNMHLNRIDSQFYIGTGNHRFCIAKFLAMRIEVVSVTEF